MAADGKRYELSIQVDTYEVTALGIEEVRREEVAASLPFDDPGEAERLGDAAGQALTLATEQEPVREALEDVLRRFDEGQPPQRDVLLRAAGALLRAAAQ